MGWKVKLKNRKNTKATKRITSVILCFIMAFITGITVNASASGTVDIPVTQHIQDIKDAHRFEGRYILTAVQPNYPMPEGKTGGDYSFSITGDKAVSIAPIEYIGAGIYEYTLHQEYEEDSSILYDDNVYTIIVAVANAPNGQLESSVYFKNKDGDKTREIVYINKSKNSDNSTNDETNNSTNNESNNNKINTGDSNSNLYILIGLLVTSWMVIILFAAKRKNNS